MPFHSGQFLLWRPSSQPRELCLPIPSTIHGHPWLCTPLAMLHVPVCGLCCQPFFRRSSISCMAVFSTSTCGAAGLSATSEKRCQLRLPWWRLPTRRTFSWCYSSTISCTLCNILKQMPPSGASSRQRCWRSGKCLTAAAKPSKRMVPLMVT